MTENVENLILEHLRALRAGQERIEGELKEIKARLTHLESAVIGSRRDAVMTQEDVYRQQTVIDQIKERLDRIERRLELSNH
ncbi:MAG: hypothetical protein AB1768_20925 [Pseudomonadota bacterium]|jgi:tetrahydromethanopterin S-methyltransferase subunit G